VNLDQIKQEADLITLHVPLNMEGEDATFHLADAKFFNSLERQPVLINSCRGEVVDNQSAKAALKQGKISALMLDCWENEPDINLELLAQCLLATPHIAGYSKDGKANGTTMSIQAVSRFFNLGIDHWQAKNIELPAETNFNLDGIGLTEEQILARAVLFTYDIRGDDQALRKDPPMFEKLRGDYPVRREFPAFTLYTKNIQPGTMGKLKNLGFNVESHE
jgi:erythronate-4-phosphate dehydrogenase